jgi:hypothetical protein
VRLRGRRRGIRVSEIRRISTAANAKAQRREDPKAQELFGDVVDSLCRCGRIKAFRMA